MREQRDGDQADAAASDPIGVRRGSVAADDLASFGIGAAPIDDGLLYPGALPRTSFVFTGDAVEPIDRGGAVDGAGDAAVGQIEARLSELGASPLAGRHAVLAYGSNRSPAQLRAKFAGRGVEPTVPVLVGQVTGLSVVHAAGVTRYGAIPATLVDDADAATEVAVTFLDDAQLAVVDATEPRHDRARLDTERHPLTFALDELRAGPMAESVASCRCYWSRRPVLTRDGAPIRLAAIASTSSPLLERTQREVVDDLLDVWAARGRRFASGAVFSAAVRSDRALHSWVVAAAERLVTEPVGILGARPPTTKPHH